MAELLPGCAFPSVHIVGSFASKLPSDIYLGLLLHCFKHSVLEIRFDDLGNLADSGGAWRHNTVVGKWQIEIL